jgi:hypothetical protein
LCFQFHDNALVSVEMLRMLETATASVEVPLQTAFSQYDTCSSIRKYSIIPHAHRTDLCGVEYDDECKTATEIYACGKDSSPSITSQIVTAKTGNTTIVKFGHFLMSSLSHCLFFTVRPTCSVSSYSQKVYYA